jgi:ABC-type Fe3+-hydroxamate transport system substrate-binding protein
MIADIGRMTQKETEADQIAVEIEVKFANFKPEISKKEKVAYLIWKEPLMVVGNDNFIHSILEWAGWTNVFQNLNRYPSISELELKEANPERIMLSTEPYNFTEADIPYFKSLLPMSKVQLVDGERFSWYGSRMKQAPAYINTIRTS